MQLKLKTGPSLEPVSSAEAKLYLKIDSDTTDDTLIAALITAARRYVEEYLGRALITQTWELFLDGIGTSLPALLEDAYEELYQTEFVPSSMRSIVLPRPPLLTVTSIKCYDEDDVESTWASTNYRVDTYSEPGRVLLAANGEWPTDLRAQQAILVTFTAGYGATAADVPDDIRTAIKRVIAGMYEGRQDEVIGTVAAKLDFTAKALLAPYRVVQL